MSERSVSVSTIAIALGWITGLAVAVADIFLTPTLAGLAFACIAAACTVSVRKVVERHARNWAVAYKVGEDAGVRSIRGTRHEV